MEATEETTYFSGIEEQEDGSHIQEMIRLVELRFGFDMEKLDPDLLIATIGVYIKFNNVQLDSGFIVENIDLDKDGIILAKYANRQNDCVIQRSLLQTLKKKDKTITYNQEFAESRIEQDNETRSMLKNSERIGCFNNCCTVMINTYGFKNEPIDEDNPYTYKNIAQNNKIFQNGTFHITGNNCIADVINTADKTIKIIKQLYLDKRSEDINLSLNNITDITTTMANAYTYLETNFILKNILEVIETYDNITCNQQSQKNTKLDLAIDLIDEEDNIEFKVFISVFYNGKIIIANGNSTNRINQAYAYILDFLCNEENYRKFAVIED